MENIAKDIADAKKIGEDVIALANEAEAGEALFYNGLTDIFDRLEDIIERNNLGLRLSEDRDSEAGDKDAPANIIKDHGRTPSFSGLRVCSGFVVKN
jgi:hypothetical protein